MTMINEAVRYYLLQGLEATPIVLARLLEDVNEGIWDRRPDPERFTLREVIAHLADWETIWFERLEKMHIEDVPFLPGRDPDQLAKEHDYAHADVQTSLQRFQEGRGRLLKLLESLEPQGWSRIGRHKERGIISVQDLVQIILGHDGYHLRQVAEWIE